MTDHEPTRRVQRVRYELKRRNVTVRAVKRLSEHVLSITFGGDSLADFVSGSFDDHVKLFVPGEGSETTMRDYTPRSFDPSKQELTIEFALHATGPATRWAASAQVGDSVSVGGPRGSFIIPFDYAWHLLVADDTGLAAVARRLEELPSGAKAIVVLHVEEADRRSFATDADVEVTWTASGEALHECLATMVLPAGEGYAWCACESALAAAVRKLLVEVKGHDPRAIRSSSYWKRGVTAHHQNLD